MTFSTKQEITAESEIARELTIERTQILLNECEYQSDTKITQFKFCTFFERNF